MKKSALEFAASKPRYKNRKIDWYSIWEEFEKWENCNEWKEQKLCIERLVNKQLAGKK